MASFPEQSESVQHSSRVWRIITRLPPYDHPHAAICNSPMFHVNHTYASCMQEEFADRQIQMYENML